MATVDTEFLTRLFRGSERRAPGGEPVARRVAMLLGAGEGDRILVVGCGGGAVARAIARTRGCFITAIDRDEVALGVLRAAAQKDGVEGLINPVQSTLDDLEVPPAGFQAVVIEGSLRYLGETFGGLAAKARRFLGPDGLLLISASTRVGRTLPSAVESHFGKLGDGLPPPLERCLALEAAGYEPLAAEAYSEAVMDEWYRFVERSLAALPPGEGAESAAGLKREVEIYRREGGRNCVGEVLFVARRKEPGEKPPVARGE